MYPPLGGGYDEAAHYFRTNTDRTGIPTKQAQNKGAYVCGHGATWWWLRGPGEFSSYAALVGTEGNANDGGNYVNVATGGIRPAMWITAK